MYLDTKDFQTIWRLAHNWVGADPETSDPARLSIELKEVILRLMHASLNQVISVSTRNRAFFFEESFLASIIDHGHFNRHIKCLRKDVFDKTYLDSIYVKRSDVLRWCQSEFLSPPPIWRIIESANFPVSENGIKEAEEDEDSSWYDLLTEKRKQKVACLEMARALWKINPRQTYTEMYQHPIMKMYCTPTVFSFRSFKKWSGRYASEYAKNGGKIKEST